MILAKRWIQLGIVKKTGDLHLYNCHFCPGPSGAGNNRVFIFQFPKLKALHYGGQIYGKVPAKSLVPQGLI